MQNETYHRQIELLDAYQKRLHEREMQLAQLGINADPIVRMEIAEIKRHITELEKWVRENSPNKSSSERIFYTDIEGFAGELTRFAYWYQWNIFERHQLKPIRGYVGELNYASEGSPHVGFEVMITLEDVNGKLETVHGPCFYLSRISPIKILAFVNNITEDTETFVDAFFKRAEELWHTP